MKGTYLLIDDVKLLEIKDSIIKNILIQVQRPTPRDTQAHIKRSLIYIIIIEADAHVEKNIFSHIRKSKHTHIQKAFFPNPHSEKK